MAEYKAEASEKAKFDRIRYAQVWEDADILAEALNIQEDSVCLSIASAGDNALAMLAQEPRKVIAIDLSPAQLHCLAFRVAAFRELEYEEVLRVLGVRPADDRWDLYRRMRGSLDDEAKAFWDARRTVVEDGVVASGKFENYFALFRRRLLPLVFSRKRVDQVLAPRDREGRHEFYGRIWNSWRWRLLFRVFFSRWVMGKLGRDPSFFDYVEGSVADRILDRTRYALTELEPSRNPYLHWILKGHFGEDLPLYLQNEYFDKIRGNLDRLEWHCCSVEEYTGQMESPSLDAFNLSDIFEYMSEENTMKLLLELHRVSKPGARLAYWNMLAPRSRPESMSGQLKPLDSLATSLFQKDRAFFYSRFVVEEVIG